MIVIASHDRDDHARAVLGLLREAGHPVVLVDSASFPREIRLSSRYGTDRSDTLTLPEGPEGPEGEVLELDRVGAVWWRRPQPYGLDPDLDTQAVSFALTECHEAFSGMWQSLDACWVNPMSSDETAAHKPLQLARAQELGLSVPRTLITNDPRAARSFVEELGPGRTVYKTFVATEEHWRETRLVRPDEIELLDSVQLAPVIFQEFVEADADLRVTVLGEELLAAEIVAREDAYAVDYRMDMSGARFAPVSLPDDVVARLRLLMKRLDLVYGAIDLRRTPEGDYVFLEVNPAGEWLFVEERTALPITAGMAELLRRLDGKERA